MSSFESRWKTSANIAFVKYWGKKGHQLPANPSLSLTLKECTTTTKATFTEAASLSVSLTLSGKEEKNFADKITTYLETLTGEFPALSRLAVKIETSNSFPHGTGMASSASGLSAFALCLADYLGKTTDADFYRRASSLARLASGSACRSLYGGFTVWGKSELPGSSDEYAVPFDVHGDLAQLHDSVLVISEEEKKVSSRQGHAKMAEHLFKEARYTQAHRHFSLMLKALKSGDIETMGEILENEALSLHAMMMTSPEGYMLMRPNTLAAIELVRDFRQTTKLPLYFTLDAGPNVHLIYPESTRNKIETFIAHELAPLAVRTIHDQRGEGPERC